MTREGDDDVHTTLHDSPHSGNPRWSTHRQGMRKRGFAGGGFVGNTTLVVGAQAQSKMYRVRDGAIQFREELKLYVGFVCMMLLQAFVVHTPLHQCLITSPPIHHQ